MFMHGCMCVLSITQHTAKIKSSSLQNGINNFLHFHYQIGLPCSLYTCPAMCTKIKYLAAHTLERNLNCLIHYFITRKSPLLPLFKYMMMIN